MSKDVFNNPRTELAGNLLEGLLQAKVKAAGYLLVGIKLNYRGYDWFGVLNLVDDEDEPYVAFTSAETAGGVVRSFAAKADQQALKVKVDVWELERRQGKK